MERLVWPLFTEESSLRSTQLSLHLLLLSAVATQQLSDGWQAVFILVASHDAKVCSKGGPWGMPAADPYARRTKYLPAGLHVMSEMLLPAAVALLSTIAMW